MCLRSLMVMKLCGEDFLKDSPFWGKELHKAKADINTEKVTFQLNHFCIYLSIGTLQKWTCHKRAGIYVANKVTSRCEN